jgi:hypothetical protein
MGDSNGGPNSLKVFLYMVGIPYDTFKKYVCDDEEKHRKVRGKWSWPKAALG